MEKPDALSIYPQLDERAFVLWAANWIFAGNQIHFVQTSAIQNAA
jgi:hypothetical protein